jgi:hypothetical protein|tara:strand:+ start:2111 stop:4807 length:2697 start_codon:yes stop_codon:yes gene_type:complete
MKKATKSLKTLKSNRDKFNAGGETEQAETVITSDMLRQGVEDMRAGKISGPELQAMTRAVQNQTKQKQAALQQPQAATQQQQAVQPAQVQQQAAEAQQPEAEVQQPATTASPVQQTPAVVTGDELNQAVVDFNAGNITSQELQAMTSTVQNQNIQAGLDNQRQQEAFSAYLDAEGYPQASEHPAYQGSSTAGSSTAGSTNISSASSSAPVNIDQTNPTYTAPEMAAARTRTEGMGTRSEGVQTLADAGTVAVDDVTAKAAIATSQIAPDKITAPTAVKGAEFTATGAEGVGVTAAQGEVSKEAQAKLDDAKLSERAEAAQRDLEAEEATKAESVEYDISTGAYVNKVTGKVATVQETRLAEAKTREAITGEPAPDGEAAQIMSMYEYNQLEKRTISKDKVVKNLKAQGLKDPEIAKRLADNPELVADEMDDMPEDIKTTLSGLPQEALMSAQMESLMAGMEDGEIPTWARPALAKVESNLAKRGMSASSVGRDALFNAIIQSALPIAQSNAQAIQNATSQDKQIAADFLAKNTGFQQQMNLANLSNDQQMRLANLTAQNQASSENLNAAQQTELANLNTRMQTNLLQGKIAADMNQAQLTVDQQRAVQNASMIANVDMARFSSAQQVELTNSKFMQTMVATKFSAEQQAAMQNATSLASMDMANLDKNTKLAAQNAQAFLQMDMSNLNNAQQASVLKAQNQQQAMLTTQAAENSAKQFGAASQQQADQFMSNLSVQVEQYNSAAGAAREQFNATEGNRLAAINAGNDLQAQQFSEQLEADIQKFNEQQDFQRDQWNASNAQAIEQSNTQWRRQANLADTAAQNTANQQNAQIAYNLTSQEQTQLWQQVRDEASYVRLNFENEQDRKAQLLATALGNEKFAGKKSYDATSWLRAVSGSI